jgi:glycosyltransferase involved in cell wall biosynthesis
MTATPIDVCVITETSSWGGTEVHTAEMINALLSRRHRVCLVSIGHQVYDRVVFSDEQRLWRVQWDAPTRWQSHLVGHWARLLRPLPRDACIFAKGCLGLGTLALDIALQSHFKRVTIIEHSLAQSWPRPRWGRHCGGVLPGLGARWYLALPYHVLRLRLAPKIVCVSKAIRQRLLQSYLCPARKAEVLHNAVDVERFSYSEHYRKSGREGWGVTSDEVTVFGAVGNLDFRKGFDVAIDAVALLARRVPADRFRLVIVGDGPLREQLAEQVRARGLDGCVRLAGPTVAPWQVYPAFDFSLLASRSEGLPLTLLEAMACERIPVASAVGGVPEVISHPSLGILVPPGDPHALADAMHRVIGWPAEERVAAAARVRRHVVEHFNHRSWRDAVVGLVEPGPQPVGAGSRVRPRATARGCNRTVT